MKKRIRITALGVLAGLGIGTASAQTNVGLVVNIALSGVRQESESTSTSVRITTKDLLAALNQSGGFNFDANAQLIFRSIDDQEPTVWVRAGFGVNQRMINVS